MTGSRSRSAGPIPRPQTPQQSTAIGTPSVMIGGIKMILTDTGANSNQAICLVRHEQRNVQNIIVQVQIIQREPYAKFDFITEQFFEYLKTPTGYICFGFYLYREKEIELYQRHHLPDKRLTPYRLRVYIKFPIAKMAYRMIRSLHDERVY
jgi:hypothetical protein